MHINSDRQVETDSSGLEWFAIAALVAALLAFTAGPWWALGGAVLTLGVGGVVTR